MIRLPTKKGITLVETIIYTGLLAFLCVLVVRASLSMHETYVYVKSLTDINNASSVVMNRLSRYIRDADSVNTALSTLNSNPGILVLNVQTDDGSIKHISFSTDASKRLIVQEQGLSREVLTPDILSVSNLVFRRATTTHSEAVKIEITLQDTIKGKVVDRSYYNSIILRGSY